jgi:hypothetical protein
MKPYSIHYRLIFKNWKGIISMSISIAAAIFLWYLILAFMQLNAQYQSIYFGFIPSVSFLFEPHIPKNELNHQIQVLKQQYPIKYISKGASIDLSNVQFRLLNHPRETLTIPKNVRVFGIDYDQGKLITLIQNKKTVPARILQIDRIADEWIIHVEHTDHLVEGRCFWKINGSQLPFKVYHEKQFMELSYDDHNDLNHKSIHYHMIRFLSKYIPMEYTGMNINRFESDLFSIYLLRKIRAYAGIIFKPLQTNLFEEIQMLVSSDLMRLINPHDRVTSAEMIIDSKQIPVQILDSFYDKTSNNRHTGTILMNYQSFNQLFHCQGYNFLHVYGADEYAAAITGDIQSIYPDAEVQQKKHMLQPHIKKHTLYQSLLVLFFILFICIVLCLMIIQLKLLYRQYQQDLILMKLYGKQLFLFSKCLLLSDFLGITLSFVSIKLFVIWNNQLMATYYFPPVILDWYALFKICVIILILSAGCMIIEQNHINRLSFETRHA